MKRVRLNGADVEYDVRGSGAPAVFIHGSILPDGFVPVIDLLQQWIPEIDTGRYRVRATTCRAGIPTPSPPVSSSSFETGSRLIAVFGSLREQLHDMAPMKGCSPKLPWPFWEV